MYILASPIILVKVSSSSLGKKIRPIKYIVPVFTSFLVMNFYENLVIMLLLFVSPIVGAVFMPILTFGMCIGIDVAMKNKERPGGNE